MAVQIFNPTQNATFTLPSEGEIFRVPGESAIGTQRVHKRVGSNIVSIPIDEAQKLGINYGSLPTYSIPENVVGSVLGGTVNKLDAPAVLGPNWRQSFITPQTFQNEQIITPLDAALQSRLGAASKAGVSLAQYTGSESLNPQNQTLPALAQQALDSMYNKGFVLNPNKQITENDLADFLKQAEKEIDPYYSTQFKLAREGFQKALGYSTDEILRNEQELERKYGIQQRHLGEQAAEQGFAQSGIRQRAENELAYNTQQDILSGRRKLGYDIGNSSREFAQKYGTAQTTIPNLTESPTVTSGESTFGRVDRQLPLYELSPSVYEGLVGSSQYEQEAAKRRRVSELEQARRRELSL